ncbi:Histidinol-phosphate aminotransferase [Spirochaeta thermophila DSM 6578]|uniref:Histidinol-phosphate aminotransferase n=1 Tax=Winmispira thermophila (strain ATCC 700085 / DSM 6578 / Z-1203) TaxID=869211 RepID=G0GAC2_WINT7|nr:histidinol-phosphate transaminase [Spirochaeta thermophila]AEJ61741.1 Histidinol-phosphate aminotransferase [Spirochaeta thermophila DSM 6578]
MRVRKVVETLPSYTAGASRPGAIKLSSNENPLGPSPLALKALQDTAATIHRYPDGACRALKEKLAELHGLSPDWYVIGNGSDEVMLFIAGAFVDRGASVVTGEHTFSEYTFATRVFEGEVRYAPMQEGRFQLEEILARIDASTRVVFICNPNNPTGTYLSHEELTSFLEKVPGDVLVVVDEAYREYVEARDFPETVELLKDHPNLMVLRTFSKVYGLAGLRVGYGVAHPQVIRYVGRLKPPFNVNLLGQAAALAALDDEAFVERSRAITREGKAFLYGELSRLGLFYYPSEANFVCFRVEGSSQEAFRALMERGVIIRPLDSFGLPGWMRVTVGTHEHNTAFIAALEDYLRTRRT